MEGPQGAALDFVGELGEYSLTVREALHNSSFQHRIVRLSRSLQERGARALQQPAALAVVASSKGAGEEDELSTEVLEQQARLLHSVYHDTIKKNKLLRMPQLLHIHKHFKSGKTSFPSCSQKLRLGLMGPLEELLGVGAPLVEESSLHLDARGAVVVGNFGPKERHLKDSLQAALCFERLVTSVFTFSLHIKVDPAKYNIGPGFAIAEAEMLSHRTPMDDFSALFTSIAPKVSLDMMVTSIEDAQRQLVEMTSGPTPMTISNAFYTLNAPTRTNLNQLAHLVGLGGARGGGASSSSYQVPTHLRYGLLSSVVNPTFGISSEVRYTDAQWVSTEVNPADALSRREMLAEFLLEFPGVTATSARSFLPQVARR